MWSSCVNKQRELFTLKQIYFPNKFFGFCKPEEKCEGKKKEQAQTTPVTDFRLSQKETAEFLVKLTDCCFLEK
jgi:hypothetical protein